MFLIGLGEGVNQQFLTIRRSRYCFSIFYVLVKVISLEALGWMCNEETKVDYSSTVA